MNGLDDERQTFATFAPRKIRKQSMIHNWIASDDRIRLWHRLHTTSGTGYDEKNRELQIRNVLIMVSLVKGMSRIRLE
jgi:hypothetical protein